jgi:ubiquinone/menaquinone biosynthesis C-methylase UbiE
MKTGIKKNKQVGRQRYSEKMEGFIARWYDKNARKFQKGIYKLYLNSILNHVKQGDKILEVASGPGYLAIDLSKSGTYEITGIDISYSFVEIARTNAKEAGAQVNFIQGNVVKMPFPDNTFDFIACTAAFKNFHNPAEALNEMFRVLKPNSKAWIDDLRHDISKEAVNSLVEDTMQAKGLSAVFMKWSFNSFLKKSAYTKVQLQTIIESSDFERFQITETPTEFEIVLFK